MAPLEPQKILVIRLSSIGDILLSTPLLRLVAARFPRARIDYVTKRQYADLLGTNPRIHRLLILDPQTGWSGLWKLRKQIRQSRYDLILDIHKNFRSLVLAGLMPGGRTVRFPKYYLKRFLLVKCRWDFYKEIQPVYQRYFSRLSEWKIQDDGLGLEIYPDQASRTSVALLLGQQGLREEERLVGIAAGAGFATKRWPVENFVAAARLWQQRHPTRFLLFGDERDRPVTRTLSDALGGAAIDLAGRLNLLETAALMERISLLVCNDSGLMHMASALRVKTVAIFGPTTRALGFFPVGAAATVVEHAGLSCRPCSHVGSQRCPKGHFRCMLEIPPERVARAMFHMDEAVS